MPAPDLSFTIVHVPDNPYILQKVMEQIAKLCANFHVIYVAIPIPPEQDQYARPGFVGYKISFVGEVPDIEQVCYLIASNSRSPETATELFNQAHQRLEEEKQP